MIAWDEAGSGEPLVLVHGLTEDRRAWDSLLPRLTDRFRCVRLDLRGHGGSPDADDLSALAMAADVGEVVAAAGIDEPPVLVGHSLGAVVVTAYASQAPTRAVVAVDQSLRFGDFARAVGPLAAELRGPGFPAALAAVFEGLGLDRLPPADRAYATATHDAARQDVVLGVWSLVLETPPDELDALAASLLPAITVPFLAVHGGDPGEGYEAWLRALVPSATVEVWDDHGHYPHLVDPTRFAARLRRFVDALP